MLKKLCRKIIIINMSMVGAVLLAIFSGICFNAWKGSLDAAESALAISLEAISGPREIPSIGSDRFSRFRGSDEPSADRAGKTPHPSMTATVAAVLDSENKISELWENGATMSEELLTRAVELSSSREERSGILFSCGLIYMKGETPHGSSVAFADLSAAASPLFKTAAAAGILCIASLGVMLFLSAALSRLAVRPVSEAWEAQKRFVAEASHELKTPLTVILANNSILASHPDETVASQRKWIESTGEESFRMKSLIERLLTLARSDAGYFTAEIRETDLAPVVQEQVLSFEPAAYEKNMTISCRTENIRLATDPVQLSRILQIYLDNAVKYGARGTEISVELAYVSGAAVLSVKNFGETIPSGELSRVFDRFYRADKSRTADGFGLGLSIAKSIAGELGVRLSAESSEENGTVFRAVVKPPSKKRPKRTRG